MKFKNKLAALALVGALVGGGAVAVSPPSTAQAHTPSASADCRALTVNATNYETKPKTEDQTEQQLVSEAVPAQPAVYGEKPVITPAVEYQPAVYGEKPLISEAVEYQPAVYEIEYEFRHKKDPYKIKWSANPNWNAEQNDHSKGWYATGNTRNGKLIKAEVQAQDAVYGEALLISPEVLAQDAVYGEAPLISPEVPAKDAVYETVVTVEGSPADSTPNKVVVTINGEVVANESFGTSYSDVFEFADETVANEWSVTFTAWNDPDGSKGWTKTISGTTTPCTPEVPTTAPANPQAALTSICGSADVTLTNPLSADGEQLTASFVVNIDGEFHQAYSVEAGATVTDTFEFAEDSGTHVVEVFQAGTSEWKSIAKTDVASDCIPPQPEDEVTEEQANPLIPCDAVEGDEIATTTTVTTTPYVFVNGAWVPGESVVTTKDSVYIVTAADAEAAECPVVVPPKPETKIEFSEWTDGEFECTATEVPQTRTKSVTKYVLVDNVWVAQEPVVSTENRTRPLTEAEQEAADIECAGPQPENKVTETEWVTGEYECGDTTVQITRQVTSTEYVRDGAEWVEGESVTTPQTETRDLTAEEIAELDCTVAPPTEPEEPTTPTEPEEPTTPVAPAVAAVIDALAATGANPIVQIWAFTAGSLMVALGALAMVFNARRRQLAQQGTTED